MSSSRLEAFSDGVIAIVITIMVLELRVPEAATVGALRNVAPDLLIYLLSFVFLAIYWNNHHHLFQAVDRVDGRVLWANMHLLFWLSLVPFTTAWMGEAGAADLATAIYGIDLLLAAVAYYMLTRTILATHPSDSRVARALRDDRKGTLSVIGYLVAVPVAWLAPWASISIYVAIALAWLVPDKRFEEVERERAEENDTTTRP